MTPALIGMLLAPPLLLFAWWTHLWWLALVLMALPTMFDNFSYGGKSAATQRLLSPNVRATASALIAMVVTLAGTGGAARWSWRTLAVRQGPGLLDRTLR